MDIRTWYSFYGLFLKELRRFMRVYHQAVISPVVNGLMFWLIFSMASRCGSSGMKLNSLSAAPGFLISGILGMSIIQNAFANTVSSIVSSKAIGYLSDFVTPPFVPSLFVIAMTAAAFVRAFMIASLFCVVALAFCELKICSVLCLLILVILISCCSALIGLIVGFYTNSFEQMSAVTNYIILPPLLLSGVFFSIRDVPIFWRKLMLCNPFFYMIDGLRYGFLGVSEYNVGISMMVLSLSVYLLYMICVYLLRSGILIKQ